MKYNITFVLMLLANIAVADNSCDYRKACISGHSISSEQAQKLELLLERRPGDIYTRAILLGYYGWHMVVDPSLCSMFTKYITWFIRYCPSGKIHREEFLYSELARVSPYASDISKCWKKELTNHCSDVEALLNAAHYFHWIEPTYSEYLYLKAGSISGNDIRIYHGLALLYKYRFVGTNVKHLTKNAYKKVFQIAKLNIDPNIYFYGSVYAWSEYDDSETELAKSSAEEVLAEVNEHPKAKHHDYVIYSMCTLLGCIAMDKGDISAAEMYLYESVDIDNAIEITTMHPDYQLANKLIEKARNKQVLLYLEKCRYVWRNTNDEIKILQSIKFLKSNGRLP